MKRRQTDSKPIMQRVLYFVCQLQSCGDPEFMSAMRPNVAKALRTQEGNSERVVLFSTN